MRRILALVLLLTAVGMAGERRLAEFRLRKDATSPMRGWIVKYDDRGFVLERFGGGGRTSLRWADLLEEDARRLRIALGLEMTEDERLGLMEGHEIHFRGGGSVRGLLLEKDEDGTHRVKVEGLVLPYPGERIDRVEKVKIKEDEAFSPEEVYLRRVERQPPHTPQEHQRLADYLYDVGDWQRAKQEYEFAMGKDPLLRARLEPRLAELEDYLRDEVAAAVFAKEKGDAVLNGRYRQAMENIRAYIEDHPDTRRRGERLIEEIENKWMEKKRARFHRVKNEELDRAVRRYLITQMPDLETARAWISAELAKQVEERTKRRLALQQDEMEMFLETRSKGSPHYATYWGGSFILSKRAKIGQTTKQAIRGDPEKWWSTYRDVNTRATWLKAYAAERLPDLFEVVRITTTDCDRCGGTGRVRKMSIRSLADGRHEWRETCPRCFGARQDRGVAYR
ncbi:MAG: hypothetical protein ACYTEZ_04600 [Planctomycetota bacterium]|jgi:tetratricopeptide (TPR) repeat protein